MGNARKHCAYNLNGDVFMEKIVENDKKGETGNQILVFLPKHKDTFVNKA